MVCTLPKDLLRTVFSYTESKTVNETLFETATWASKRILEIEDDFGSLYGEVEIECVFICNNMFIKPNPARFYFNPTESYAPIFGNWEPHISFNLKHTQEGVFEAVVLILWEDWSDPTVNVEYKKEIDFSLGENPFEKFDLEMTAPRSAGECKEALLAFQGVNVGDDLCDQEELDQLEKDSGLLIVQDQYQVYRGKELAEYVLL